MLERSYTDLNLVDVESPKALARTIRALDEAVVAGVYDKFWGPGDDVRAGATPAHLDPFCYIAFPAGVGAANKATYNTPVPPVWRGGQVRPTLYYSGSAADTTKVIKWSLLSDSIGIGGVLGATSMAQVVSTPGPTAIGTVCSCTFDPLTLAVAAGDKVLGVRVTRAAADTYAGDGWFLGLLLQYFPARAYT